MIVSAWRWGLSCPTRHCAVARRIVRPSVVQCATSVHQLLCTWTVSSSLHDQCHARSGRSAVQAKTFRSWILAFTLSMVSKPSIPPTGTGSLHNHADGYGDIGALAAGGHIELTRADPFALVTRLAGNHASVFPKMYRRCTWQQQNIHARSPNSLLQLQSYSPSSSLMTFQFCMMQGQSSKLPVSKSRSWNSQSSNWQPSRLCDGFTSSVADSQCGSNSNNSDSLILQFRQCSSLFSLIRLPRVTSRASPFCFFP